MALLLNLLTIVSTNPLVERLLLVSIELTVVSLGIWGTIKLLRIRSARVCALLWLLVLTKAIFGFVMGERLPVWNLKLDVTPRPAATMARTPELLRPSEYGLSAASAAPAAASFAGRGNGPAGSAARSAPLAPESLAHALMQTGRYVILTSSMVGGILAAIWLIGVAAMLAATGRDLMVIRRLYRSSSPPASGLRKAFAEEARRLKIKVAPSLRISDDIVTPALVGWFRPVVLMPEWIAREMAPAQMRWLLGHELMHWKHLDTLGLLVRRAAQAIFWFHPAVWIAGRCWEHAMERACDRALVADMDQARDYAQQLYGILSKLTQRKALPSFSTGLFVTRTQVGRRIELLLTNPLAMPARLGAVSIGSLLALAALTLPAGIALVDGSAETPRSGMPYDVAQNQTEPATEGTPAPELIVLTEEQCNGWLKVDLGDQTSPPGWVPWSAVISHGVNEHTMQAFSVPFEPYFEIEISHDVLWRRDPHSDEASPRDRMLRDGVRSFGEIRLTFRDLDPGDYDLAPISFSPEGFGGRTVKFDVTLNGNPCMRGIPTAYPNSIEKAFSPPIRFTIVDRPIDEPDEVTIGFRPQGGPLWLSGFMFRKAGQPFGDAVSRMDVANAKPFAMASAAIGEKAYIDRGYTIVSLPVELEHQILIQTANSDKNVVSDRLVTLDVNRPVTVYLCFAAFDSERPSWAAGFTPTGGEVVTTDRIYDVFSKRFPAGSIVLGGNNAGEAGRKFILKSSQYLIVIAPESPPEVH